MLYLINYADKSYYNSQKLNTKSSIEIGNFDKVFECSVNDINKEFYEKNKHILEKPRGAGYWLWKPYLIKKYLEQIHEDDYLMYTDSGCYFINSVKILCSICDNETQGIIPFMVDDGDRQPNNKQKNPECKQTKRDAYVLMGCDNENFWYNNTPSHAAFIFIKKNSFTINFINEWLHYAQDERILTDIPNTCGLPNLPEFVVHRHDQSIYTLLVKKYNLLRWHDLSQWGNPYRNYYPQLIQHTRNPN